MKMKGPIIVVVILAIVLVYVSAYTVDEREQVVITQFGKVIGPPKAEPGLYFLIPFIQKGTSFPKNLLAWDGPAGQVPTKDKRFVKIDAFARWRIVEPIMFLENVRDVPTATRRLNGIIDPAVKNLITGNDLIEAIRKSDRELETYETELESAPEGEKKETAIKIGRQQITQQILEQAQPKVARLGIELVDVKIKRINYIEEVRQSVYRQMIAERNQMAEKFRSEGRGESQKWLGQKERDLLEINSNAYREAQEIRGKADAEATAIFAEAFGKDPEFYSFIKTLEIYNESLDESSSLVLSTDSEFLQYLKGYSD